MITYMIFYLELGKLIKAGNELGFYGDYPTERHASDAITDSKLKGYIFTILPVYIK